ncbi:hypothetical protein V6N13_061173 [Hibiscus sabdariffa]
MFSSLWHFHGQLINLSFILSYFVDTAVVFCIFAELPAEGIFPHRRVENGAADLMPDWELYCSSSSPDLPAQAEDSRHGRFEQNQTYFLPTQIFPPRPKIPPSQGSKLSRQNSKSVTCRDPCRGRPGQEIQSGVRLDQHIFMSISVQRACQFDAEKIAKAGSQAHVQGR